MPSTPRNAADLPEKKAAAKIQMTDNTANSPKLELFGTRTCRYTAELQDDLEWDGRPYTVYYVDEDESALRRLAELVEGPCMVPVLVEDGEVKQVGYNGRGCYVQTNSTSE